MVARIKGGAKGRCIHLSPPRVFKDVLKLGPPSSNPKDLFGSTFVVEELAKTPSLRVKNIACNFIVVNYEQKVCICCFNDF